MISFEIKVEPQPAPRPRFTKNGGIYNDIGYTRYKQYINAVAKQATGGLITSDIVKLDLTFFRNIPITSRRFGDIDNLVKGVMDGLIGAIYSDDAQVYSVSAHKIRRSEAGIWVIVYYAGTLAEN